MDDTFPMPRRILAWLISPGVLKLVAALVAAGFSISYLSRLKADQIAARNATFPHIAWLHGTSDTRLQQAINRDDGAAVAKLLAIVPSANIRRNIVDRLSYDKTANSLEAFLDAGWNANGIVGNGQPLMNAVRSGQPKALAVLLKHGANPNILDDNNRSAMLWASGGYRGSPRLIELLATYGAKVDEISVYKTRVSPAQKESHVAHDRPITVAASTGNLPGLRFLLKMGARPNLVPGEDIPPLAAAAFAKHPLQATQMLLDAGADPNGEGLAFLDGQNGLTMPVKATPLFLNSWFDHPDSVKLLLQRGADPKRLTSTGKSAVDVADPDTLAVLKQSLPVAKK